MIRANEEWEFLYNNLKRENKILKEYETYIFDYAHKNLGTDTLGMHIAAGLVKEHRELKAEVIKLRAENERMRACLLQGINAVGRTPNESWKLWTEFQTNAKKALRGADET